MTAPTTTARMVSLSERPGSTTKAAATGRSRLMPKLLHKPAVSRRPCVGATGSASVRGASDEFVNNDMVLSLRRHYPVRFQRSTARSRPLSPVCPSSRT